ncbi:MAG: hypothetical protein SOZ80_03690 [Prevotella sp.]|uniref:hypothetical protein n=1 Tax=Prevotella sp. TaxID=59823 RepID=UPI002A276807|nr:hypothetical protein [Prevotella sp.]MDD7317259.1 hypothetical protein [Prevotellaceae bacterium]MDY4019863.1 hypothetical protein [Prevotella sp.]
MKTKHLLTALLLGATFCTASAQKLSLGNYAELEEEGDKPDNLYNDGSYFEIAPINYYLENSGSQTILPKADIATMAGKNITTLNMRMYNNGYYGGDLTRTVTIYIGETNKDNFKKEENRYRFFDTSWQQAVYHGTLTLSETYNWAYMMGPEFTITFDRPFYYSGENNLVVTITATGEACTDGGFYIDFPKVENTSKSTLTFPEKTDPTEMLNGDLRPAGLLGLVDMPAVAYGYADAAVPDSTWRTFTAKYDTDLNIVGLDAFKVTATTNGEITYEKVTEAPKGANLILRSLVAPVFYSTDALVSPITDNLIKVSDGTVTNDETIYVFGEKNGKHGFYHDAGQETLEAGTFYVIVPKSPEPEPEPTPDPDGVLTIGNFYGKGNDKVAYDGFNNHNSPMTFNYNNSGTQTIYPAEWLEKLNGKAITSLSFSGMSNAYTQNEYKSTVKVYLTETDHVTFPYNDEASRYEWIQTEYGEPSTTYDMTADFLQSYIDNEDFHLTLNLENNPYTYNGKSLVVTITNESDKYFDPSNDLFQFYFVSREPTDPFRTAIFSSDTKTFMENYVKDRVIKGEDNEFRQAEAPAIQMTYIDAAEITTGISTVTTESSDNAWYNLQGQRIAHPRSGIFIHKGKKVVVR